MEKRKMDQTNLDQGKEIFQSFREERFVPDDGVQEEGGHPAAEED